MTNGGKGEGVLAIGDVTIRSSIFSKFSHVLIVCHRLHRWHGGEGVNAIIVTNGHKGGPKISFLR